MQLQISAVYISTVLSKLEGIEWRDGTAFYFAMHMSDLMRFPLFGLQNKMWFYSTATYLSVITEFSVGTLIWVPRLRKYVITLGIMLHTGIEYAMVVPLFSFTMISSYVTFASGSSIDTAAEWLHARLARFEIEIPADVRLPGRWAELLRALDSLCLVRKVESPMARVDADLVRRVLWRLPATWAFAFGPALLALVILPVWWLLVPLDVVWPIAMILVVPMLARRIASGISAGQSGGGSAGEERAQGEPASVGAGAAGSA